MIRTLVARSLARLAGWCERESNRLYRVQSGIEARRLVRLTSENHTVRPSTQKTKLSVTYAHHDEWER